jgi:aryl-alcohol dehydrogenase-like predicted oxidoreductase
LDLGVAYFDTADSYGDGTSEKVLGRALAGHRDRATVATKVGYVFRERRLPAKTLRHLARPLLQHVRPGGEGVFGRAARGPARAYSEQDFSVPRLRLALEASLRRLRTDHVDLYQLHGPPDVCNDDVTALMSSLQEEGKIGGFGVGLDSLEHALDWLNVASLGGLQLGYGILDPDAGKLVIPAAAANGVPVISRGVFASGLLARVAPDDRRWLRPGQQERRTAIHNMAAELAVDPLQLATWFVTTTPGVDRLLVGTASADHLQQVVRFIGADPPPDIRPRLTSLTEVGGGSDASG